MLWDKKDRKRIKKYGFIGYSLRKKWAEEDEAFDHFAAHLLNLAIEGVEVSPFLASCPDLYRTAVDWYKGNKK